MPSVHPFSIRYRPIQDAMNFLYGQAHLASTIAQIKTLEADVANGTFLVGKFTKLLMDSFLQHQSDQINWTEFTKDFNAASGKAQALSDFLRDNFLNVDPPLQVFYETLVVPSGSAPDVKWAYEVDSNGKPTRIRVTYYCTS